MRLTGHRAIEYAEHLGNVGLKKYGDPIETHRIGLSVEEALEIAKQDPSLIYIDVDVTHPDHGTIMARLGGAR